MLDRYRCILDGSTAPRFHTVGDLHTRSARARGLLGACRMCARRCGANRAAGEAGWCGVGAESRISSEFLHLGEEPELVPSHTVFFSGCTMACAYCQNADIALAPESGVVVSPADLAERIDRRAAAGARNVNFVGGDPAPHLATVLETLAHVTAPVPVVWNSNMYLSDESLGLLDGVVDVFLADLRYGSDACAQRLSDTPDYVATVRAAIARGAGFAEVMVRHLVLPGHVECCTRPSLEWLATELPDAYTNLMFQYRPCHRAGDYEDIGRSLVAEDIAKARRIARDLRLRPA